MCWSAHDVRYHQTGRKRLHQPVLGDLELDFTGRARQPFG
jgi:hypothetical protein